MFRGGASSSDKNPTSGLIRKNQYTMFCAFVNTFFDVQALSEKMSAQNRYLPQHIIIKTSYGSFFHSTIGGAFFLLSVFTGLVH